MNNAHICMHWQTMAPSAICHSLEKQLALANRSSIQCHPVSKIKILYLFRITHNSKNINTNFGDHIIPNFFKEYYLLREPQNRNMYNKTLSTVICNNETLLMLTRFAPGGGRIAPSPKDYF